MNVIGEIGSFIIEYQEPIQIGAIVAMAIIAFVVVVKIFSNAKKKREILSQINHTVSEINTAVSHMSEKKTEVIYIDSRVNPTAVDPKPAEVDAVPSSMAEGEGQDGTASPEETGASADEEPKITPSLKYFSRDCAISKNGKMFTIEELNAQIRE